MNFLSRIVTEANVELVVHPMVLEFEGYNKAACLFVFLISLIILGLSIALLDAAEKADVKCSDAGFPGFKKTVVVLACIFSFMAFTSSIVANIWRSMKSQMSPTIYYNDLTECAIQNKYVTPKQIKEWNENFDKRTRTREVERRFD